MRATSSETRGLAESIAAMGHRKFAVAALATIAMSGAVVSALPDLLTSIASESQLEMSWDQLAPAVAEMGMIDGDSVAIVFDCGGAAVDRWILQLTATADSDNLGAVTFALEGADHKTVRTGLFRKISGTYSLPLNATPNANPNGAKRLKISVAGGAPPQPLLYVAKMSGNGAPRLQIALKPEVRRFMQMPKYAIYPRQTWEYVPSGHCEAFSESSESR